MIDEHYIHRINFSWLIRLRWAAIAGHVATIAVSYRMLGITLPLQSLGAIVAAEVLVNGMAMALRKSGRRVEAHWLALSMALDVLLLTALLYFTGGPFNPFSFLYLVHIALAAVVLRPRSTWALAGLSLLCSGILFVDHRPLPLTGLDHDAQMYVHLRGMWVALGVATGFIVYFLMRVMRALAEREAELSQARHLAARQEKLASLATLAAGAAHELATPLATIAVTAKELERQLDTLPPSAMGEDVGLIRAEVERCRAILDRMAAGAGESAGEGPREVSVADVVAASVAELGPSVPLQVAIEPGLDARRLRLPLRALSQALRGLVQNAMDASPRGAEIQLEADERSGWLRFVVRDRGQGMPADVLARAGEPFFTTKPPGRGMGLGLFLARALVERLGGQLQIQSAAGEGTTAIVSLPTEAWKAG